MAWMLVNVSPKMSSHRAGWIARMYSSVRSCRIFRSSTSDIVAIRLDRRRPPSATRAANPTSADAGGGASSRADISDPSSFALFILVVSGDHAGEHVVERGARPMRDLQLVR